MARNMQPIAKRCKALNLSPAVMGYGKKTTNRNPKGQMRRKQSEYATQLTEKQKVKFVTASWRSSSICTMRRPTGCRARPARIC